jgi:hypothetical protein
MGTAQLVFEEVVQGGATGSMFCAFPDFPAFFPTIVVQNVVQVPWLPDVTEGHVTPKGVPLGGRMRNRKLGFPPFFRVFSDMLCSAPRPRSHCVISKSTFDSLSHPIEGHSAFILGCDWLYR